MAEEEKVKDEEKKSLSSDEPKKKDENGIAERIKNMTSLVITMVTATGLSYYLFHYERNDVVPDKVPKNWKTLRPQQIKEALDKYIVGQDEAKKDLSVALYTHLKKLGATDKILPHNTPLLVGPTGSGKTTLCKCLAKIANIPFCFINATSLTITGYVGQDIIQEIGREACKQCQGDIKAKKPPAMIFFVDEFDKLKKQSRNNGPDIGGEGVQDQLLQLEENGFIRYKKNNKTIEICTKNMMFIYLGAFSGIENNLQAPDRNLQPNRPVNISHEDVQKYGFKRELAGRISTISQLEPLTKEVLIKILKDPKEAIIIKYQNWFKMENIKLSFNDEANEHIADVALKLGLGARGLDSIIAKVLKQHMYEGPSKTDKSDITINKEYVQSIFPSEVSNVVDQEVV